MHVSKREEHLWEELHEWRQSFFEYEATDLENTYDQWLDKAFSLLPENIQDQFFSKVDDWLFQLNALLRGTTLQQEAAERILAVARSMNEPIHSMEDMKRMPVDQLTFLAEQQASKHRLYSLFQGGVTGSGQTLAMTSDFVAMLVINLRAVQLTAMSFGYDVQSPKGLLETLKVFNVATMPERMKMFGWEDLMEDLQKDDQQFYYEVPGRMTEPIWIDEPLKQFVKTVFILLFSKRKISGVPLISIMIGAGVNYQTTRKITRFAIKYYQYKHLYEKHHGSL
ncbi:ABC transporter substrate-binding protein [Bacillus sp. J14TS2]|uniref:EcsC family protein n=1 Tax=Bacillus sp. J14TS2 TaxID=2807188 RepID=UPI001B2833E9|nr:EcsC family protein [Bacillus sp. J14TS2]GIN74732.1 ABC transporter substrate-binding protein [Bacillus sp. J14TS2]